MEIQKLKMYKSIFTTSPSPREKINRLPRNLSRKAKTVPATCLPAKNGNTKIQNVQIHFYNFTLSPRKHESTPRETYQGKNKTNPRNTNAQE
jgi:hypothetical protein